MRDYWAGLGTVFNITEFSKGFHHSLEENIGAELLETEADGFPVVVVKDDTMLSYIQAASYLNVSLDYFKREISPKLGVTPENFVSWGKARYPYKDLATYKKEEDKMRMAALTELCEMDQEIGLM